MQLHRLAVLATILIVAAPASQAAPIPATVTGTGSFSNSASLLTDGIVPSQDTFPGDTRLVVWNPTSTSFTLDFGSVQTVASLLLSADNNDNYLISYSADGNFSLLFTVLASDGTVTPAQGGTDTFSTDPTSSFYVGRSFVPVSARYLQLSASGGDSVYTAGELDAFAPASDTPVPEPASVELVLLGLVGLAVFRRRRTGSNVLGR